MEWRVVMSFNLQVNNAYSFIYLLGNTRELNWKRRKLGVFNIGRSIHVIDETFSILFTLHSDKVTIINLSDEYHLCCKKFNDNFNINMVM